MSDKKQIYVVTSGCYSDYRIDGVFDDLKLAEEFREKYSEKYYNEKNEIEVYNLNPTDKNDSEVEYFYVEMYKSGDVRKCEKQSSYIYNSLSLECFTTDHKVIVFQIQADDEQHAIKICNERRARIIANNKWPECQ
jgi:hypothetical protein